MSPIREDPEERKQQEEKYFFLKLRNNLMQRGLVKEDILKFFLEWLNFCD